MNARLWLTGMRPKTLPASIAPVFVGAAAALVQRSKTEVIDDSCHRVCSIDDPIPQSEAILSVGQLCILFALLVVLTLCMQIAVNFANDYSDGIRGTDSNRDDTERVCNKPQRLVASGVSPSLVLVAAIIFAVLAAMSGITIAAITSHWWLIALGLICYAAGWFYTGGKYPYGYYGFGELSVFIFFGLVSTLGTQYVMAGSINKDGILGACAAGLNAVGLLMMNNYRDIETDRQSGKRTYATLVGQRVARFSIYAVYGLSLLIAIIEFAGVSWHMGSATIPAVIIVIPIAFCFGVIGSFFKKGQQSKAFALAGQGILLSALCWAMGFLFELL